MTKKSKGKSKYKLELHKNILDLLVEKNAIRVKYVYFFHNKPLCSIHFCAPIFNIITFFISL